MLSFWEKNSLLNYDIIIIGSGILGLSTACEIKERNPDKSVLILERGIFPTGASTKNAGFLCYGGLTEILADIKLKGEDEAVRLVEMRWVGMNMLRNRLGDDNIGFINCGEYELIDERYLPALDKIEYVNGLVKGIFSTCNTFQVKNEAISRFGFNENLVKSIIYSEFESQIDTGKMITNLLKYASSLGVKITNGCEVNAYDEQNGRVTISAKHNILKGGISFQAESVIFCTNAFTGRLIPGFPVKPGRGMVIATKPIDGIKLNGIYHYDEGYYYFRNYAGRVLLGGGRNLDFAAEESSEFEFNEKIYSRLVNLLDEVILPGVKYEVDSRWVGIMAFTENKLPFIQKISEKCTAAVCCNGMGIALSSYIARDIANRIIPD